MVRRVGGRSGCRGGLLRGATAQKQKFHVDAKKAGVKYQTRYEFQKLWNGLSIEVSPGQLESVLALPNVSAVYPVGTVSIPETSPASIPDLATALKMTGADIAQSELGFTGKGVKVAVMDTGTDYDHPDLGGCFGAGLPGREGVRLRRRLVQRRSVELRVSARPDSGLRSGRLQRTRHARLRHRRGER